LLFECDTPVAPGDAVSDGQRDVGEVINVSGSALLAVIPFDIKNQELTVNDSPLLNLPLQYFE
jgi:hypothetical protein